MTIKKSLFLLAVIVIGINLTVSAQEEARLLRFPAIYDNQIVFTYAGDLYTVQSTGGTARKLTNHIGYEMFARFSPDGKTVAFTAQYDGNTEVYTMNSQGGIPKRVTYTATLGRDDVADRMGPNNIVFGWMNDNQNIIFRSRKKSYNSFNGSLFKVNIDGSLPEELPFPRAGFCSFSPDNQQLAFNRIFREFRTWKRYRGGMADDVWIFDFNTKKTINITDNPAQDIIPMWFGNKIYFLSDRGEFKRMNLYSYDLQTKETKKITEYKDFDIKFPSLGNKAIVYENGGFIYKMDLNTETSEKVKITIQEDFVSGRSEYKDVSSDISNFEISPDGNRALFGAHGDIFTVPAKYGEIRNITKTSAVHERNSKWSPNGKWISFIADNSGEEEIYIQAQDGSSAPIKLSSNGKGYKYQPFWSPDSKKILWADSEHKLKYIDIDTKNTVEIDYDPNFAIRSYSWSPDNKWVTYTKSSENRFGQIFIYSLDQKKSFPITDNWYNSGESIFSDNGKYLFFTSDREYNVDFSQVEFDIAYNDMSNIYFVTLSKETKSLFEPLSDEVEINKKEEKADDKNQKKDKKSVVSTTDIKIDTDGIQNRIGKLPLPGSRYFNLSSVESKLFYAQFGNKDDKPIYSFYDFESRKSTKLGKINGYEISADKKKMLVSQNGSYAIINLPASEIEIKEKLNLDGMQIYVNKKEEWKQIYNEAWRQMREFFFDPNMHGVDWLALKNNYEPLVKYVNHRNDLTYIIGELISELNVGHAYVSGGDRLMPKQVNMGLLGAEIEKDKVSGYFKITKILKGQNWDKSLKSPLTEIGVNANVGDFILEINGKSTKEMPNLYSSLINTAGKQIKLSLNSKPIEQNKREVTVIPISDESQLYYLQWVTDNIEKVNKATNGKVGYIHIPDMGIEGLNEFVKYYYPQLSKKALIIDVRGNGGGFVSPLIIERLRRIAVQINISRNGTPEFNRDGSMNGPLVMLADEFSASDGDIVTYRFKKQKLGKVVGKRTWGGVVGYGGFLPLVDGGVLIKPEHSRYDLEGKEWIMEGKGVEPDIFVDNDPYLEYTGIDQQLNKSIEVILDELKTKEKSIPNPPQYPDKK
ncbi:MAG: PDZ domain-containing protein [Bacteroidales bacterium]|nr:PDZ domain-containing protein [Bacteroidales bacterium]MBN2758432.1 PDZ domain-containing protein [Bacteroidales bacterium]